MRLTEFDLFASLGNGSFGLVCVEFQSSLSCLDAMTIDHAHLHLQYVIQFYVTLHVRACMPHAHVRDIHCILCINYITIELISIRVFACMNLKIPNRYQQLILFGINFD